MTTEQNFFINLPQGKTTGFCQPVNSSVWKDGGTVVEIYIDCLHCTNGECMMFKEYEKDGKIVKMYTPHEPQWPNV